MSKNLLIVESPAKAKTIEKFLGKDFIVKSSYGHIRDLDKGNKAIDVENDFELHYIVSPEKHKVVKELKDQVRKSEEVWLATDEDREGEAISWHLCEELGLDITTTKRIVFSEITKPAILKAVSKPRSVNVNLVNAQQARRALDRLVGFELSEVLWRKVKNKLSAGRVQSVAVRLIVDREREIINFNVTPFFKITANFLVENDSKERVTLKAENTSRLDTIKDANEFLEKCNGANFTIASIEKRPIKRTPAAPFTTSTLQQEASRKLGFSVNRTMSTAQKLYEQGFITYMRTDSPTLSQTAIDAISEEINRSFGDKYLKIRNFKPKSSGAQEAHEAIRPTYMAQKTVTDNSDMQRLYELIYKRTIASQMSDAALEKTVVKIDISTLPKEQLEAIGEVLVFDGFLKLYRESSDDDEDEDTKGILPPLKLNQLLQLDFMNATESFTRPPGRFTEASLVKKLEELGIGRPSTYAPTITKIMEEERGYVTKESREGVERTYRLLTLKGGIITSQTKSETTGTTKNALYPSDLGMVVTDFLSEHFERIMDYKFTARVEDELDKIASEGKDWKSMLRQFYKPFHDQVATTMETADRAKGKRVLGIDPISGYSVLAQMTRFGPVIQIGDREELSESDKPKFANLRPGQSLETITYDEAMDLFQLPMSLGIYQDIEISVNTGRYGPYIKFGDIFVNLPKGKDPMSTTTEEAIQLIQQKLEENAPIGYFENIPITKGKGRFGPFVKWGDLYVNIPVRYKLESITESEAVELLQQKLEKEANRYIQHWPNEKISIENGRWGPYVKFGKNNIKIPKVDGQKLDVEELKIIELDTVKSWITSEIPNAFNEDKKSPKKNIKKGAKK